MFACLCGKKRGRSVVSQEKEMQAERSEEEASDRNREREQLELLREKLVEAQERLPRAERRLVPDEEDDPALPLYHSQGSILISTGSHYPS